MSELDRLAAAVIAAPTDMAPRRAYADAVRTIDPQRAELIDVQLEIRDVVRAGTRPTPALRQRSRALVDRKGKQWAGKLAGLVDDVWYIGGFVEGVRVAATRLPAVGATIIELAPIRRLGLTKLHGHVPEVASLPLLAQLISLDVEGNQLTDHEIETLVASPHLRGLQKLSISRNPVGLAALRAIARADLPALRFVATYNTNAPLVEHYDDAFGPGEPGYTAARNQIRDELGTRPWLETLAEPPAEQL